MYKTIEYIGLRGIEDDLLSTTPTDDDTMIRLKAAINELPLPDKTFILLYAEVASMREVAKRLNVSLATAFKRIKKIQNKIKEKI